MATNLRTQIYQVEHELYLLSTSKPRDPSRLMDSSDIWTKEDTILYNNYQQQMQVYDNKKQQLRYTIATLQKELREYIAQRKALKKFRQTFP